MRELYKLGIIAMAIASAACERRPINEICESGTLMEVEVDWRVSGITPSSGRESDIVHRVSLRFFPKDGSAPFDRYLEENIFKGLISLPEGVYSVVVFNEAIDDPYWTNAVVFTQTNSYTQFAANIAKVTPEGYSFYPITPIQNFVSEPHKLASWSLDDLVITPNMRPSSDPNAMINSLKKIVLRKLFADVRVVAEVVNLKSAMRIEGALVGLSDKVYMASGLTEATPSTHIFAFTAPIWSDDQKTDGAVERRYYGFGALPQPATYTLWLSVVLVTGERYVPDQPLHYNVTQQVDSSPSGNIDILVGFTLPKVEGNIDVGQWDDQEITIQ